MNYIPLKSIISLVGKLNFLQNDGDLAYFKHLDTFCTKKAEILHKSHLHCTYKANRCRNIGGEEVEKGFIFFSGCSTFLVY